jgi:tetratricopeptide (TPR) repeat protein
MNPTLNPLETERKAKLRRLAIISLAVVAILVGCFFGARPAYRSFTGWRSKRLAAQAEKLISENQWTQAVQKAQAAFLLNRTEPAAIHAMAKALTSATNAAALPFWQQLILAGHATDLDRRAFVELAIRTGSLGPAADEMRKLLAEGPNQPVNLWLASQLFAALGDYSQTVNYATRAQMHDPNNKQYQLFLSSLWFDSSDPEQRSEARKFVWTIARDGSQISLEALNFLTRRQDLTTEQRRELITLLKQHPLGGISQQLLALDQ